MLYKVARKFSWEMSHRLPMHNGLCRNIHGHSYSFLIEISGELGDDGMVIDFFDIDKLVGPIVEELDHSFVCNDTDDMMIDFIKHNDFKHLVIEGPTTAENLLVWFLNAIKHDLTRRANIKSLKLRLYETADSYAEIECDV